MVKRKEYYFIILLLVTGLTGRCYGQNSGSLQWTPEQMIKLRTVSSPVISPSGKYVAYEVRQTLMKGEKSDFRTQIWIATTDGSMNRQFSRGEHSARNPKFSPDGKYLSFISSRNGDKPQVYRIYLNGGEAEQLTHAENGVNQYAWSPDASSIAYTMTDPQTKEEKKKEKEKRDVVLVDQNYKYSRLYVLDLDAEVDTTKHVTELTAPDFQVKSFDWSPDGSHIVFSHQSTPKINDMYSSDISVVPADSGAVRKLVSWDGADNNPHYSPDGNTIVFESSGGQQEPIGLTDVYRIPAKGGNPTALAHTPDRSAHIVGWVSNGSALYISEARHTYTALYQLPLNGDKPLLVTPEDGVYGGWSTTASGNQLAFTFEQTDKPANIYYANSDNFEKQQLTDILADVNLPQMGKTEVVRWESKDGRQIEGLLTYPIDYQKGKSYPLILNVHGGPAGVHLQRFTGAGSVYPIQFFAAQGYAILRPNPRGSTGYGKEFRYANYQDWGYGDYQDLMSGVDKVIDMGVANPDSLVEMGWSYGGYMTSFIVTRTNRFKAVSMGAGLPNLISMVNTTDIPRYLIAHMGGYFWQSDKLEQVYEKHSAMYHVRQISTPVQIIHGMEDHRVPTSQGKEFYRVLKQRNVPTELIMYPRTPHGPREPKFIADVPHRILEWFNKYLKR